MRSSTRSNDALEAQRIPQDVAEPHAFWALMAPQTFRSAPENCAQWLSTSQHIEAEVPFRT